MREGSRIKNINMQIFFSKCVRHNTYNTQIRGGKNHYHFILKNKINNLSNYYLQKNSLTRLLVLKKE